MTNPTGYTALDLVGYTDKGDYSSSETYVKNDLANYNGIKWRCLIDDTTDVTPTEGLNWTKFIEYGDYVKEVDYEEDIYGVETPNPQSIQHQLTYQTNVLGAKNLIPYPYLNTTRTVNGVTMTDNGDGSVTLNGTCTAQCYFSLVAGVKFPCKKQILGKKVRITLQYTSSSQNGKWFVFFNTSRDGTYDYFVCSPSSKASDKVSATGYVSSIDDGNDFLEISIKSGFSATNLKIYPMLTLASDPDDTYVPYAMTNRELTEKIANLKTITANASDFAAFKTAIASL